jgi:pilus assembly protein Flp/PilA
MNTATINRTAFRAAVKARHWVRAFSKDERGSAAIEYGLISALIGVAIVAGATATGTQLDALFTGVSQDLLTANGGP